MVLAAWKRSNLNRAAVVCHWHRAMGRANRSTQRPFVPSLSVILFPSANLHLSSPAPSNAFLQDLTVFLLSLKLREIISDPPRACHTFLTADRRSSQWERPFGIREKFRRFGSKFSRDNGILRLLALVNRPRVSHSAEFSFSPLNGGEEKLVFLENLQPVCVPSQRIPFAGHHAVFGAASWIFRSAEIGGYFAGNFQDSVIRVLRRYSRNASGKRKKKRGSDRFTCLIESILSY